ncbi:MAG: membrane protein insertion efficiency factor YidD, partial [Parasporobacterium sp.]|nr:membrane protein insertion efficiency factor YidD [Parasporobacterium sp.]
MKKAMIRSIRMYQKYLSPLKSTRCPYIPTCSQYG